MTVSSDDDNNRKKAREKPTHTDTTSYRITIEQFHIELQYLITFVASDGDRSWGRTTSLFQCAFDSHRFSPTKKQTELKFANRSRRPMCVCLSACVEARYAFKLVTTVDG